MSDLLFADPAQALQQLEQSPSPNEPITSSLKFNVVGQPRKQVVKIPDYLTKSSRANGYPNQGVRLM